jgi:hypothetical protein
MMGPTKAAKKSRETYTRAAVALAAPRLNAVPRQREAGHARAGLLAWLCCRALLGLGLTVLLSAAVALGLGEGAGEWPWLCALLVAAVAGFQLGRLTTTLPWLY